VRKHSTANNDLVVLDDIELAVTIEEYQRLTEEPTHRRHRDNHNAAVSDSYFETTMTLEEFKKRRAEGETKVVTSEPRLDIFEAMKAVPSMPRAACAGSGVNFHPEPREPGYKVAAGKAIAICNGCPERDVCREWGLENERFGIWGGLTEEKRKQLRKELGTQIVPACGTEAGHAYHRRGHPGTDDTGGCKCGCAACHEGHKLYRREYHTRAKVVVCAQCGEEKGHEAKGLCKSCYRLKRLQSA
jgi:WhiB family transcriptional regulator, redox-sensing transcriptional regulator